MFNKEQPVRRLLYLILQLKETKNQSESVTAVGSCSGTKKSWYGGGGGAFSSSRDEGKVEKPRVSVGDLSGISCHQLDGVFLLRRETDSITHQPRIYGAAAAEGSARLFIGSS